MGNIPLSNADAYQAASPIKKVHEVLPHFEDGEKVVTPYGLGKVLSTRKETGQVVVELFWGPRRGKGTPCVGYFQAKDIRRHPWPRLKPFQTVDTPLGPAVVVRFRAMPSPQYEVQLLSFELKNGKNGP